MIVRDRCKFCKDTFLVSTSLMLPGEELDHICPTCEDKITQRMARLNECEPISSGIPDANGNLC